MKEDEREVRGIEEEKEEEEADAVEAKRSSYPKAATMSR